MKKKGQISYEESNEGKEGRTIKDIKFIVEVLVHCMAAHVLFACSKLDTFGTYNFSQIPRWGHRRSAAISRGINPTITGSNTAVAVCNLNGCFQPEIPKMTAQRASDVRALQATSKL